MKKNNYSKMLKNMMQEKSSINEELIHFDFEDELNSRQDSNEEQSIEFAPIEHFEQEEITQTEQISNESVFSTINTEETLIEDNVDENKVEVLVNECASMVNPDPIETILDIKEEIHVEPDFPPQKEVCLKEKLRPITNSTGLETSMISRYSTVHGDITGDDHIVVDGTVFGNINTSATVSVHGSVHGTILASRIEITIPNKEQYDLPTVVGDLYANDIILNGKVSGTIVTNNELIIQNNSILECNITANIITMEAGAKLSGQINKEFN